MTHIVCGIKPTKNMKSLRNTILYVLTLILSTGNISAASKSDKISVLIVDGFSNHGWKQTTKVVKSILETSGLFQVAVSTSPSTLEDDGWKDWDPEFGDFDVVLLNCNNIQNKEIRWPAGVEKKLEQYVSSGGGLYILHSANNSFAHWPEYNEMIGLGWRTPEEGKAVQVAENGELITIPVGEGKATYHGPRYDEVIYKLTEHPINKNFPNAWKTPDMELYKFARGPAKNLTVLSYAKDEETNINWPVEWVVAYGKGRVYNSSMGHLWKGDVFPVSYKCVGFQTTMIRATEWLATGETTYNVPADFPTEYNISLSDED